MKILEFDTRHGIYSFEMSDFETIIHAHPAIEIIMATAGVFTLSTPEREYKNVRFAVIDSNVKHAVQTQNGQLALLMCEHKNDWVKEFLTREEVVLKEGVYIESGTANRQALFQTLFKQLRLESQPNLYDERVTTCIELIEQGELSYNTMMRELQDQVFLSESRLSHLFKDNVGISLKQYLVWNRLKRTIKIVLDSDENLFSAGLTCGFHDQAHLSRAFKNMLGVNPSKAYNSRTLQI
ncbi:MAG: helix-turn-helix transcriptional regulator [Bacteroidota bacterium]